MGLWKTERKGRIKVRKGVGERKKVRVIPGKLLFVSLEGYCFHRYSRILYWRLFRIF